MTGAQFLPNITLLLRLTAPSARRGESKTKPKWWNLSVIEMLALINRFLDWVKSLFWKEEMELTLVGLQYSGKTTFVNVIAVSVFITPPSLSFSLAS